MRSVLRSLRRATQSVRVRVALITAVTFALVLVGASVLLLNAFERRLVNRVRDETKAAVVAQAQQLAYGTTDAAGNRTTVLHSGQLPVLVSGGVAVAAFPTGAALTGSATAGAPADSVPTLSTQVDEPGLMPSAPAGSTDVQATVGEDGQVRSIMVSTFDGAGDPHALPFGIQTADQLGLLDGGPSMVATLAVDDNVSLAAVSSLGAVQDTIDSARTLLWWVVPALVVVVGGLAWVVVGRALRPVHAVTRQLASIGSDSLHERVPAPGAADEVGELTDTMNSMLDRLERATLVSRQLVSDASHELRTPIAVLRTELEVARRDPATDWQAVSVGMLREVERLQGLVDDLLLLARARERGMRREEVDVVDVVAQVGSRRRAVPVAVQVDDGDEPITVQGDAAAMSRAVDHLVANAARHADSTVQIGVERCAGGAEIRVDDDGAGIAVADRSRVLERFVRLDEARARDVGGSGLGLAVANDVAVAHGGRITIADSPLGGARVTLTLPRA